MTEAEASAAPQIEEEEAVEESIADEEVQEPGSTSQASKKQEEENENTAAAAAEGEEAGAAEEATNAAPTEPAAAPEEPQQPAAPEPAAELQVEAMEADPAAKPEAVEEPAAQVLPAADPAPEATAAGTPTAEAPAPPVPAPAVPAPEVAASEASTATPAAPLSERKPSATAEVVRASDSMPDVRQSPVKVGDITRQLAAAEPSPPNGGPAASPPAPAKRVPSPVPALSQHDKTNTTNVAVLLQQGAFKLVPGKDTIPYQQLTAMRLEDGIDATRKEEYLSDTDFSEVFGMDRTTFAGMPAWKRFEAKKAVKLF